MFRGKHKLFKGIKKFLLFNLDKIFQNLTSAYTKGGDEMYISITPETLVFMNFLLEAGIIMYHRNDKTKVRLMDML